MKILLKIILLYTLLTSSLFANTPKIDEYKVDLYYANGIMIQDLKIEARRLWKNQVKELLSNNVDERNQIGMIEISYNMSQSFFDDVFESLEQVMSDEWGWEDFSNQFRVFLETINVQDSYDAHIPDLETQVKAYKESIKLGHGVIVIAHSQGNLYTNEAYKMLIDNSLDKDKKWMQNYFHYLAVATPANYISGKDNNKTKSDYVLIDSDIINVLTSLEANTPDTQGYSFPSKKAHDFYKSYLGEGTKSKPKIYNFIIDAIHTHTQADSQWDYTGIKVHKKEDTTGQLRSYGLIKMEHLYDKNIVISDEIYPFSPGKKVYYVEATISKLSGFVLANPGGTDIYDTWSTQTTENVYMLNNQEKETIDFVKPITTCFTTHNFWSNTDSEYCVTSY